MPQKPPTGGHGQFEVDAADVHLKFDGFIRQLFIDVVDDLLAFATKHSEVADGVIQQVSECDLFSDVDLGLWS